MLIGVPALLGPDFLATLRAMGHGDELAIVDANYPAEAHGRRVLQRTEQRLLRINILWQGTITIVCILPFL